MLQPDRRAATLCPVAPGQNGRGRCGQASRTEVLFGKFRQVVSLRTVLSARWMERDLHLLSV
jgi:hypothetical protein